MTTYYLKYKEENIERITEQTVEQELLSKIENIRTSSIKDIERTKDSALSYIDKEKNDPYSEYGVVAKGVKINGDIHFNAGDNVDAVICSAENKGQLGDNYVDVKQIYYDTVAAVANAENRIENNIRQYMVDNGYVVKVEDDGDGNITVGLVKEG